jgi:hypothetical protein
MTAPAQDDQTSAPAAPAIYAAVAAVMKQVTYVPKAGQYDGGRSGSYAFRKFEDTAAALAVAFRQHGIFVGSRVVASSHEIDKKPFKDGGGYQAWMSAFVTMEYTFTSLVDGSSVTAGSIGEGKDTSDKASAKAMTMAMKSALTQAFMIATDDPDPDGERPGDYSPPIGGGEGYDPNQAARDRHAAQRQAAGDAGVNPPQVNGTRAEKVAQWVDWVRREFANEAMTLERLAFIHMLTSQKQLLGVDAGGVPLETRIKAELARWQLNPNGAMPTPEQAAAYMARQQGTTNHPSEVES